MDDKTTQTALRPSSLRDRFKARKKTIIAVVIMVVLAFVIFRIIATNLENRPEEVSDVINVHVATAQITTLENTVPLTGRLEPVEEVSIIPKMPGQVVNVYVKLGDRVSKGTLLFDLDKTQISTAYNQANEVYVNAKLNYERMQTLFQEGAVSLQQFEQVKMQYETASQTRLSAADGLASASITAPISGYITSINVVPGGMASQAMPSATIANIDQVQIRSSVSEALINKIHTQDKVKVLVQSVSAQPFIGTITALSPAPAAGSLTYPLIITIDNGDAQIKPGMSAEIVLVADKTENALVVPSNAVMIKGGKTIVALIDADNKVVLREVVLGIDNGSSAQIKSGLKDGDTVVISGQQYLDETSTIKIIE
jgi:RND family efflux transporter MFP subunit